MSRAPRHLAKLTRIAQLRADQELRNFAAIGAHVNAVRATVAAMQRELDEAVASDSGHSVRDLRDTVAMVQYRAGAVLRAERDLARMMPAYEVARAKAVREFGRARAMDQVADTIRQTAAQARQKKADDQAGG